jgi:hypothetical protein
MSLAFAFHLAVHLISFNLDESFEIRELKLQTVLRE